MAFKLTPIKIPRKLLAEPVRIFRAVENAMTGTALAIKVDFDTTTQTWKDRPKFVIKKTKLKRTISTDSDIYRFVSRGTRVRFVAMTPDFVAKTRPGVIGSGKGKGGVLGFSKHPLPGIKARDFEPTIQKKWQKEFPVNVQRAIDAEFAPK